MPYLPDAVGLNVPLGAIPSKILEALPRAAIEIAGRIPEPISRRMIEHFLNQALRAPLAAGEFAFLQGRIVAIHVSEPDWSITITASGDRRLRLLASQGAETRIGASARDFIGLAAGHIDPDTLFFQRRLRIDGDVALGLETKNTLDGIEPGTLPAPLRTLLRLVGAWLARSESLSTAASQTRLRLSNPARPYQ